MGRKCCSIFVGASNRGKRNVWSSQRFIKMM
jgi:hypothetical protein